MKTLKKYRIVIIISITFLFANFFIMSDAPWTDDQNNIYSWANGRVGIGKMIPNCLLHLKDTDEPTLLMIEGDGSNHAKIIFAANETMKWNIGLNENSGIFDVWDVEENTRPLKIFDHAVTDTLVLREGKVGIGTIDPSNRLTVNGTVRAKKLRITESIPADFVFEEDYNLRPLEEVESFIKEKGHLPAIPSGKEVEANGIEVGDMNSRLLQKIEELTLYIIDQNKRIEELEKKLGMNE